MAIQTFHRAVVARKRIPTGDSFYVDNTNGNDANPGTEAQPWKTLAKVESSLTDGASLYFKRGETWTTKGTADANTMLYITQTGVTLTAYGVGALPIISGGGTVRNGIKFPSGATGNTTSFLRIYNCGGGTGALWVNDSAGENTAEDCEFDTHTSDACATSGVGCNSILRRCDLSGFADDGFTCHGLNGVGSSVEMYECNIHDGFDGLNHSVTNGGTITTLCEDCWFWSNSSKDLGELDTGTHTFRRTKFGKDGETISGGFSQQQTSGNATIFEACLFDATESSSNGSPSLSYSSGATGTFKQCTFVGNAGPSGTGSINLFSGSAVSFVNCIFSNWFRRCYRDAGTETATANYCLAHAITTGTLSSNTNQVGTGDPLFIAPASGNFAIGTGSPAIGAGTNTAGVTTDLAGNPFANPPSVGCYEYVP